MNWIRENKFLTAILVLTLAGAAVLLYLLTGARSEFAETSERYQRQAAELRRLQALKPYPDQENLDQLTQQRDAFIAEVNSLRSTLAAMEYPMTDPSPEEFQDILRATVSEVQEMARAQNVALPEGFYLGFPQYQASPPRAEATSRLAWQLQAVTEVVTNVIRNRVLAIESISRVQVPGETGAPAEEALVRRFPFTIVVQTEQSRLRATLNQLANTKEQFLIVESLRIENTRTEGPSRQLNVQPAVVDPYAVLEEGETLVEGQAEQAAQTLQFVVGTEKLNVALEISAIDFSEPAQAGGGQE